MSRWWMSVMALGLVASMAMGVGFDFGTVNPIGVPVGGTTDILVLSDAGNTGGMSLYLEALGGFEITAVKAVDIGGFWTGANASYEDLGIFDASFNPATTGPFASIGVGSGAGNITIADNVTLAKVTISSNGLAVGDTGSLTTNGTPGPRPCPLGQ